MGRVSRPVRLQLCKILIQESSYTVMVWLIMNAGCFRIASFNIICNIDRLLVACSSFSVIVGLGLISSVRSIARFPDSSQPLKSTNVLVRMSNQQQETPCVKWRLRFSIRQHNEIAKLSNAYRIARQIYCPANGVYVKVNCSSLTAPTWNCLSRWQMVHCKSQES